MINLYYDNIFKGWPLPNGALASKYFVGKFYGYHLKPGEPVIPFNRFYYLSVRNKAKPVIFTKDQIVDNLYYPIEVKLYGSRSLLEGIPKKTIKRLQRGHLKVLLLCFEARGYDAYDLLKKHIEVFKKNKINDITVVSDELNKVYNKFLDVKVLGFDYSQVLTQELANNPKSSIFLTNEQFTNFDTFDIEKFNPIKPFYSHDYNHSSHRMCFLAETKLRNLEILYNNEIGPKYDLNDPLIYNKFRNGLDNQNLTNNLQHFMSYEIKLKDRLQYYYDSLVTIVTQKDAGKGNILSEEAHTLHTDIQIWSAVCMGKPFVVVGSHQIMRYLNNEGYFTFPGIINETYDRVSNIPLKIETLGLELERIQNNFDETYNNWKKLKKYFIINRQKFLNRDHISRFINLYDNIQYR